MEDISRRRFLEGALLAGTGVAAAGALAACSPKSTTDESSANSDSGDAPASASQVVANPQANGQLTWLGEEPSIDDSEVEAEVTVDVIIVGCGTSGTTAARSVAEEGATVAVFEKADAPQGRSGDFAVINGKTMDAWGKTNVVDPEIIVDHEMNEMCYYPNRSILSKWAYGCGEVFDWYISALPDLYISPDSFADIPDGRENFLYPYFTPLTLLPNYDWKTEANPTYPTSVSFGPDHLPVLRANWQLAEESGKATGYWGHFVEKLIKDESGRITGLYARNAETGGYVKATATKGVILATGEYAGNDDILGYYAPEVIQNGVPHNFWPNMDVEGKPTNTGDGLKLGAWVNAGIQQHHPPMIHWIGAGGVGTSPYLRLNALGKRFMNEDMPGQQVQNQTERQPGRRFWMFWDSQWPEQVQYFQPQHASVNWVHDEMPKNLNFGISSGVGIATPNAVEEQVEADTCLKADTLDALLDQIDGIDKKEALASISRYNDMAKAGKDEDFGKPASRMFVLENGPFYAAESTMNMMLVCPGGLISDEDCHVYDNDGKVIPGLYAAGNIQGSRYAVAYPIALKGISHSLCMFYGYVAGKNAVAGV